MNRRSLYFIYQGLLTIVLLLFFFYEKTSMQDVAARFSFLALGLCGVMLFLARAPQIWLARPPVQAAWFLGNVILTSLALRWVRQPTSDLYLIYFLVIFGTAFASNIAQSFLVALMATCFYMASLLKVANNQGLPAEFWLRVPFLWVAASFTAMLSHDTREEQRLQEVNYQKRLFHMEGLATLGQLSGEIAHRIKAPLTTIRVNAEVLALRSDLPSGMKQELLQIQTEVDHCKTILQKLLELGRIEEMDLQPLDLNEVIQSAINMINPQLESARIQLLRYVFDGSAPVHGDPTLLREAIIAVLQNAVEAMPDGGTLKLGLHWIKKGPWWSITKRHADSLDLVIEDSGVGIPAHQLENIFRPLYTTKPGRGNGLGLSAALRIMDKHKGTIRVSSEGSGGGARFTLSIPRARLIG